jgi:hypothetical protein
MSFLIHSNFFTYNYPSYGNCFTFNTQLASGDDEAGKRLTSMTGARFEHFFGESM